MQNETIRAYRRNTDGTLEIIQIVRNEDGEPCDGLGLPLQRTVETEELVGWPDTGVRVWLTDGGVEVLVPEASDPWERAVATARECGAEAARQHGPGSIPDWLGEPVLPGDWEAIEEELGTDPAKLDAAAAQELYAAWRLGYSTAQAERNGTEG